LGPLLATFLKGHDLSSSQLWPQNFFVPIFRCFYLKMNKFQGYYHWKSYFHQKSTHPTVYRYIASSNRHRYFEIQLRGAGT
jgi:hypothetical protein